MLRKSLIALAAVAALGASSAAMAGHNHGTSMPSHSVSMPSHNVGMPSQVGPTGRLGPAGQTWTSNTGKNWSALHSRHSRHFRHNRFFFGVGFAGPYYDSCWRLVQTYYGWQRVWVCGDYPYWGY